MCRVPAAFPEKQVRFHRSLPVSASRQWRSHWCSPAGGLPLRSVMYSPLRGSGSFELLTADVTKTRLPKTMGDDQPAPGMSAFQRTLVLASHLLGRVLPCPTPAAAPPRKAGQLSARAAGTSSTTTSSDN